MRSAAFGVRRGGLIVVAALALAACAPSGGAPAGPAPGGRKATAAETAFLDTLERRTFDWFWNETDARTGLTPDRWPTQSFSSVAAIGFGLTAYGIGAERGWVSREAAAERTLATLRFMWRAPQDTAAHGVIGYRGFFYHFLDPATGHRFKDVELSTIDTALLLGGVLFGQSYFDRRNPTETAIRAVAESLYARVDWRWAQARPHAISHGWRPEEGFLRWDWLGYNEAMILNILALGSPTHAVSPDVWKAWSGPYQWGVYHGQEHVGFAPLFGHQYSHVWIDFRGIQDEYMRGRGIDYFENSRRATLAQRAYAIENPSGFAGYGERLWGLTACDGPVEATHEIAGKARSFRTYAARGASFMHVSDDGTIAPTAAAGSIAFAPEVVIPTLMAMRDDYGGRLFGRYGFVDAFNPTLKLAVRVQHGVVDTTLGWFDTDYLGIDQGPILAMVENHRSGLVWLTMRKNPHVVLGLRRAGFTGGWLDKAPGAR